MTSEHLDEPFDQLRVVDEAVAPPLQFTASVRARLVSALEAAALPTIETSDAGVRSVGTRTDDDKVRQLTDDMAPAAPAVVPYICVSPATEAIEWYVTVLGAVEVERYAGDDGRIGHAQLRINGAQLFLSDEYRAMGVVSPTTLGGTAVTLHVEVPNVDQVYESAVDAGATGQRPPTDQPYGERMASIVDPFGHRWMIVTPIATLTAEEISASMPGFTITRHEAFDEVTGRTSTASSPAEVGYLTMSAPDTARAVRFYGALFGWATTPGNMGPGYFHVNNTKPPLGFTPGRSDDQPVLYFRVDDIAASMSLVQDLGGSVLAESDSPSGLMADCRDDQERSFQLWQPAPGY